MNLSHATEALVTATDPLIRARALALMEAAPAPDAVLEELETRQNPDGGWPLGGVAGQPSSVDDTVQMLLVLFELDESGHGMAEKAARWLVTRQAPRGFFREPAALSGFAPPLWADPESDAAIAYTTARAAGMLALLELEPVAVDNAVTWLQGQISSVGLLPGFRIIATAWALPAFVALGHRDTKPVKRMLAGLGDSLSAEWDAPLLAMTLTCLALAGFPRVTGVVRRIIEHLDALQGPDGLWPDEEGQPSLEVTMQVVRSFRRLGLR